jgi:hypothetical protein
MTHYNRAHAVGDIAAFAVWASVLELKDRKLLAWTLVGSALLVSILVLLCHPRITEYRGLSAIDCALATVLMALGLEDGRLRRRPALLAGFGLSMLALLGKTLFEFASGHAILAPDLGGGVQLLPGAHAFGIASGLGVFAILGGLARWRWSDPASIKEA